MVVQDTFGGWIISDGDPEVSPEAGLLESARTVSLGEVPPRPADGEDKSIVGSSSRMAFQSALLLGSAVVVGLVVFALVRNIASAESVSDDNAQELNELPTVGIETDNSGPGIGGSSSRSGSKRNSLEDGVLVDVDDEAGGRSSDKPGIADTDNPAAPETRQPTPLNDKPTVAGSKAQTGAAVDGVQGQSTPPATDGPLAINNGADVGATATTSRTTTTGGTTITTATTQPTTGSTAAGATSSPPTTAAPTTSAPAPSTTSTTTVQTTSVPVTVAPTTTAPSTTAPTTTAAPTTSTATTVPSPVLAMVAPVDGRSYTWEQGLRVEAAPLGGARSYCWEVVSNRKSSKACSDEPLSIFPAGADGPAPGPATVTVRALDSRKAELASETVSIRLIARDLITRPSDGAVYVRGEVVKVAARKVPTATDYCITISQAGTVVGEGCESDRRFGVNTAAIPAGSIDIKVRVLRGRQVIGRQSITIQSVEQSGGPGSAGSD